MTAQEFFNKKAKENGFYDFGHWMVFSSPYDRPSTIIDWVNEFISYKGE